MRFWICSWGLGLLLISASPLLAQPCTNRTTAEHDISTWRMVRVYYDNDWFTNTNRYYTSGLRVEYIAPSCFYFVTSKILLRWGLRSRTSYGFSVTHQLYTPDGVDQGAVDLDDRPFAGKLEVSHFMISNLRDVGLRFTTEVQAGLLGPLAGGRYLAQGDTLWRDQMRLDLLLGYRARLEKSVFEPPFIDLSGYGEVQLNTGFTYAEAGAILRLGRLNPPYYDLEFALRSSTEGGRDIYDWQLFGYATGAMQLVGYDATLQGGLINRLIGSDAPRLAGSQVRRLVPRLGLGAKFLYRFIGVGVEYRFLGGRFGMGNSHRYGQVSLIVSF